MPDPRAATLMDDFDILPQPLRDLINNSPVPLPIEQIATIYRMRGKALAFAFARMIQQERREAA